MNILKSEWLKLVSVRSTWLILLFMVVLEGLVAGLAVALPDIKDLRDKQVFDLVIGSHLSTVLMFSLGALLSTNEYRHGTANSTFVVTPRRERVIGAKLLVGLAIGIAGALLYIAVNAGIGLSLLSNRGVKIDADAAVNAYLGVGTGLVLCCVFGVALGAVLRNQILAVVAGLVVILLAGTFALIIGTTVGQYFPGESLLGLQGSPEGKGIVLSQTAGGLVFAGYCVALAVAGMVLSRVREIT
jgi:ABC-type transport system involved in multi-copper enzyme maturation permease subunit